MRILLIRFGIQKAPVFAPAIDFSRRLNPEVREIVPAKVGRVLAIGRHPFGSTSASRLAALRNIFPQVESIDIQPFTEALPFFQHVLTNQWFESASVRALNKAIVESARKLMPNLVWIDRGLHVYPETLQALRARGNAQLIHFSPDSHQILGNQSRHFLRGIPLYDVIVTTKPRDVAVYRAAGAQTVELMQKAFDPAIHRPIEIPPQEQEKYGCDVAYIGHWEAWREKILLSLADRGLRLKVWGGGWERAAPHPLFKDAPHLIGDDYAKAIAGGTLHLCLLSRLAGDKSTARSVEIPACGRLLLAERTAEHQALFKEGVEAEFYADAEEMNRKIDFYLVHPLERERIAQAGRARCLASYSNEQRLAELLQRALRQSLCAA